MFALLESQKIYYYWIGVVPFLCLGLGYLVVWGLRQSLHVGPGVHPRSLRAFRLAASIAAAAFLLAVFFEGTYAQVQRVRVSDTNTSYLYIRDRLEAVVPKGASVLGATSLAWALPDTNYRSYYMLFYRTNPRTTDHLTTISGYLDEIGCEYIVFNRTSLGFLQRLIQRDKEDLDHYLNSSAEKILHFDNHSYGFIEVWKVDRAKRPQTTRNN